MRSIIVNDETQEVYDITELLPKVRKQWSKRFGFEVTTQEAINVLMEDYNCTRYEEIPLNDDYCQHCRRPGLYCICP